MASSTVTLKALGLNFSPNNLELPPGSLLEANNVIIRRDDVVESRRGFKLFGEEIPNGEIAKQLMLYRGRILRHYGEKIAFQDGVLNNGDAKFTEFDGAYLEVLNGLRIKYLQSKNGNFYFTTDEGIKKISAADASEFSTTSRYITQAGGIKALDLRAFLNTTYGDQESFLPENSAVAYKLVWGKIDANNVEVLGTPSERVVVYNPLKSLLKQDFLRLLIILDSFDNTNSLIDAGDYYSSLNVSLDTNAADLRTKLVQLAEKIDQDLVFAVGTGGGSSAYQSLPISSVSVSNTEVRINFSSGTPSNYFSEGDKIYLENFKSDTSLADPVLIDSLNGELVVADVTATYISVIPRGYSATNPVGIAGSITSTTSGSTTVTITTSVPHGLKNNQEITISDTVANLNGTWPLTVVNDTTFKVTTSIAPASTTTTGSWVVSVNSFTTAKITSNEYRSIAEPLEVSTPDDTGIVDTRGTGGQLFSQQEYLLAIINKLKLESANIISSTVALHSGLTDFSLTTRASVNLEFTVPHEIVAGEGFYYKLYRTETLQANSLYSSPLEDLLPGVDYRLALQGDYLSSAPNNVLTINDNVPVEFLNKENLYTNVNTSGGEDSKPNDYPPFATDINTFKGYTFYSNTKLKQIRDLELLGVAQLKNEIDAGSPPKILISDGSDANKIEISFVRGVKQQTTIIIPSTPPLTSPAASPTTNYFDINSANNETQYRIWFDLSGTDDAPLDSSKKLIRIYNPTNTQGAVAQKITDTLNSLINDFNVPSVFSTLSIDYLNDGEASAVTFGAGMSSFISAVSVVGVGESVSNKTAVISSNDLLLPSVATTEATQSFIRILNRNTAQQTNPGSDVYAYYSGTQPGLFLLEGTYFSDFPYYLCANNSIVGNSFSPVIAPDYGNTDPNAIEPSPVLGRIRLTFSSPHNLLNNDNIVVVNSNSSPDINGVYTVEYISPTVVDIQTNTTLITYGTEFSYTNGLDAVYSDNYARKNRIYYSKYEQPEAVPVGILGNYYPVGSEEKAILRIVPLRDSLFIFKEDGLYRLSSETAPFTIALFDSSCILIAPDSVAINQNVIYCWTTQGVTAVSESGVSIVSRPIDTEILMVSSANYSNFKSATFGVGYDSDNSYVVWTVKNTSDTYATQAFRYSSLTGTWTKYTKQNTCGVLNSSDDKLYLGLPNTPYIEQERKQFTREDYADKEFDFILGTNNYFGEQIKISNTDDIRIGDVIVQDQTLTVYQYNSLLKKLDSDIGITPSAPFMDLSISAGANLRDSIISLATKLDLELAPATFLAQIDSYNGSISSISYASSAVITTPAPHNLFSGRIINIQGISSQPDINGRYEVTVLSPTTFSIPISVRVVDSPISAVWSTVGSDFYDIKACYNKIISLLNTNPDVVFTNYLPTEGVYRQEAVLTNVDRIFKKLTLNKILPFVQGPYKIYNSIECSLVYSPHSFGDPLSLKQIREATAMFANKAFTAARLGFSSDLFPGFKDVEFSGDGTGLFGQDDFGSTFFGGASNSIPLRTYVPADCQRCRYLNIRFSHNTARERFALYGITLTGRSVSTRAYR